MAERIDHLFTKEAHRIFKETLKQVDEQSSHSLNSLNRQGGIEEVSDEYMTESSHLMVGEIQEETKTKSEPK